MTKTDLQKELLEKVKEGVKPSDLKKSKQKPTLKGDLPPPIVSDKGSDEGYESDKSNNPIPTPPPPPTNLLALQKQIELHKEIKKADEKKKQELQERIKTLIKLVGEEKEEYKQNIKDLQEQNKNLNKTIQDLKNQGENREEVKEPTNKTFFCDSCQLTKQGTYTKRKVDAPFEPRIHKRVCYLCPTCSPYVKELSEPNFDKDNNPYKY